VFCHKITLEYLLMEMALAITALHITMQDIWEIRP
jgi:hypothetical protein